MIKIKNFKIFLKIIRKKNLGKLKFVVNKKIFNILNVTQLTHPPQMNAKVK